MQPFFFDSSNAPLFGIYRPTARHEAKNCGILLCYPVGEEYIRSHATFVSLQLELASAGFSVLRFDYSGCGDSSGDPEDGSLDRWRADVRSAVEELQRRSHCETVCAVGLRLGAALALLEGDRQVSAVVLWHPVVSGSDYLRSLQESHSTWLEGSFAGLGVRPREVADSGECKGFLFPPGLRSSLETLDLCRALRDSSRVQHALLIEETPGECEELARQLEVAGCRNDVVAEPDARAWTKDGDGGRRQLAVTRTLRRVREWASSTIG